MSPVRTGVGGAETTTGAGGAGGGGCSSRGGRPRPLETRDGVPFGGEVQLPRVVGFVPAQAEVVPRPEVSAGESEGRASLDEVYEVLRGGPPVVLEEGRADGDERQFGRERGEFWKDR